VVIAEEYALERARFEITQRMPDWPPSQLDEWFGINRQTDDIYALLQAPPHGGRPTAHFWQHWVNLAVVWAMIAGRADAGSAAARSEITQWAEHQLVADSGWSAVRQTLSDLFQQPDLDHAVFVEAAARRARAVLLDAGIRTDPAVVPRFGRVSARPRRGAGDPRRLSPVRDRALPGRLARAGGLRVRRELRAKDRPFGGWFVLLCD
jgi:hypothetical protein